jgi:hypothetical protein
MALLLGVGLPASADPNVARGVLQDLQTKEAVVDSIRQLVPVCHPMRPGAEVCTWKLSNREPSWKRIAALVPTDERVHLVCFFPMDGGARGPKSCTVFAAVRKLPGESKVKRKGSPSWREFRAAQQARFEAARTISEMSLLLGSGPDLCAELGPKKRRCQWRANAATPGYRILRAILDTRQTIRLTCTFPSDGTPREDDSCDLFESG